MKLVDKKDNLKRLQQVELSILKDFDQFCKENNLKYYLTYGTLLGAVRHKGFIPWDDDVDVFMKGEDYIKLEEIYNKVNTNKKYFLQDLSSEKNYYLLWDKIRLNNTLFVEKGWEDNEINNGIFIDIFPLIEVPSNKISNKLFSSKFKLLHILTDLKLKNNKRYANYGLSGKILSKIFSIIPKKVRNKYIIKTVKKLCLYKSNSNKYATFDMDYNFKLNKGNFDKQVLLPFEDTKLCVPIGYEEVLKKCYGNYLKLPQKKDRTGHGMVYLSFGDDDTEKK